MDLVVPSSRREEGDRTYAPMVALGVDDIRVSEGIEAQFHENPDLDHVNVLPGNESDGSSTADKAKIEKEDEKMDERNGTSAAGMVLK
jgi:hypothetical protein